MRNTDNNTDTFNNSVQINNGIAKNENKSDKKHANFTLKNENNSEKSTKLRNEEVGLIDNTLANSNFSFGFRYNVNNTPLNESKQNNLSSSLALRKPETIENIKFPQKINSLDTNPTKDLIHMDIPCSRLSDSNSNPKNEIKHFGDSDIKISATTYSNNNLQNRIMRNSMNSKPLILTQSSQEFKRKRESITLPYFLVHSFFVIRMKSVRFVGNQCKSYFKELFHKPRV